jgi:hypothetical protein
MTFGIWFTQEVYEASRVSHLKVIWAILFHLTRFFAVTFCFQLPVCESSFAKTQNRNQANTPYCLGQF